MATDVAGFVANGAADTMTLVDCLYAGSVMAGDDLSTAIESGAFFFNQATDANVKDCAGNKYVSYKDMVEIFEAILYVLGVAGIYKITHVWM